MTQLPPESDLYHLLGVSPDADAGAIRRAFRSLARTLHPDVNPSTDAATCFSRVSQAHAILSDPERRRRYDEQRRHGAMQTSRSPVPAAARRAASRGVLRGGDVEVPVHLSLRHSISGIEGRIEVPRRETCAICLGTGAAQGGVSVRCARCQGSGGVRTDEQCPRCHGSGVIGDPPCPNCTGAGSRAGTTEIIVALPAGVESGKRLVLKGEGHVGPRNGPRGDLVLKIVVDPDPVLRRHGIDIVMDLTISSDEAARGTSVEVPTLKGTRRLRIPAGVRDRAVLRIGGVGVRLPGMWHRGDQFVTIHLGAQIERADPG